MSAVVYLTLGWLLTVATCIALGAIVKRILKLDTSGWEDLVYRFLLGAATLSIIVFALASFSIVHKGTIYAIAILAILSSWRNWPKLPRPHWHWSAIPALIYFVFYLLHAMAPEKSPDGMSYHLGLVARYYREHGFHWFATNMYAYLSQGLEMLFLFAFAIGRHSAAALVHFTFLLLLPVLLATAYGLRGWLAGLFIVLLPVVGIDGISAYNDVALAVVIFASWQAMSRWRETSQPAWVGVAAILAGFAFSIKFTGLIAILFLLPAWRLWPRWLLAAICALPWLLKSWLWSGNPFAPFFNAWFENPWFSADFEINYRAFLRGYDLSGPLDWAKEIFVGGPRLSGTLGPLALLLPLSLLGLRDKENRRILLAAAFTLLFYPLNIGTRFLIPALPFLALPLFLSFPRFTVALPALAAILSWPSVMSSYSSPHGWFLEKAPWRAALRIESEDGFLTRKSAGYITARVIDRLVPAGETVFSHSPIPESYLSRNIIVAYQSTIGLKLQHALVAATYADYQPRFLYRCSSSRLEITRDTNDTWSIIDIEPRPDSVTCNRMTWDTPLLRDGNWISRWRTWAPARKGDWCQLSGQGPYKVWGSGDQWDVELKNCTREISPHPSDYRAEARRFALAQGIHYLAVDGPDFNSKDMIDHPDLWGIDLVAERGTMRIYRWKEEKQ